MRTESDHSSIEYKLDQLRVEIAALRNLPALSLEFTTWLSKLIALAEAGFGINSDELRDLRAISPELPSEFYDSVAGRLGGASANSGFVRPAGCGRYLYTPPETRCISEFRIILPGVRLFWVDGIHVQARLEDDAQCFLVIVGATPEGKKEFVGLADGVLKSTQTWKGTRLGDDLVPLVDRQLAGDEGGVASVAILDDLRQAASLRGGERNQTDALRFSRESRTAHHGRVCVGRSERGSLQSNERTHRKFRNLPRHLRKMAARPPTAAPLNERRHQLAGTLLILAVSDHGP